MDQKINSNNEKILDDKQNPENENDITDTDNQDEVELNKSLSENDSDKNLEIEENNNETENLKSELESTKDKLLRALAENENVRKQMDKIRQESAKYGTQPLARELLNILDNFDRALSANDDNNENVLLEGFLLIKKEILNILEKFNIKKISALGQAFDANYHQAMFEKDTENYDPGMVCEIVQEGYTFHDRLLRPVLVGVSKEKLKEENIQNEPLEEEPPEGIK